MSCSLALQPTAKKIDASTAYLLLPVWEDMETLFGLSPSVFEEVDLTSRHPQPEALPKGPKVVPFGGSYVLEFYEG